MFGGSGFLGSHVADFLTKAGMETTIYDLKKSEYLLPSQKMIVGDITDENKVQKAIAGNDYVYHFAGIADIKEAVDNPVGTVKCNVLSTMYMLEACRKYNVERFVFASTIYVYSEHGSFYRSSKQASELFIENYRKAYNVNFTILRYGSLYGKRSNHFNFINNVIRQALTEGVIERDGDGNEIRNYINVLDAAQASVEILTEEFKNSYVMITGSQSMQVRDVLNMIGEMLNNKVKIKYTSKKIEEHYQITPYSFRPRVAKKYLPPHFHDLGQGILDCIYENYEELVKEKKKLKIKL